MTIKDKIQYYSDNMSIPFLMKNYVKLRQMESDIKRYIKKELEGDRNMQFSSSDLRVLCMALDKTHKALNKKINFVEFEKRFEKHKLVTGDILKNETLHLAKYIMLAGETQRFVSLFSYHAVICYLVEQQHENNKKFDDELFTDLCLQGMMEAW